MLSRRQFLALSSWSLFAALTCNVRSAFAATAPEFTKVSDGWPYHFTDLAGREITIDTPPRTFIDSYYLANYLAVGGEDSAAKLLALPLDHWQNIRYGEYKVFTQAFPFFTQLPSIGGYHDAILNAEKIIALHPDVLFIGRPQIAANSSRIEQLEKAGIHVVVLDYHSMKPERHLHSTRILGHLLGRDAIAQEQCQAYAQTLGMIFNRINKLPDAQKHAKCYVEIGNHGLATYGNSYNNTILWGAILNNLQADNIGKNMNSPNGTLDREFVVAQNPKYIIIGGSIWENSTKSDQMMMGFTVSHETALQRLRAFAKRPLWSSLTAVKNNDLYAVDHGSLRCMMDCYLNLFLAKVLYPATFADQDPAQSIASYYHRYLPQVDARGTFVLSLKE